jgi:hypothetical protein
MWGPQGLLFMRRASPELPYGPESLRGKVFNRLTRNDRSDILGSVQGVQRQEAVSGHPTYRWAGARDQIDVAMPRFLDFAGDRTIIARGTIHDSRSNAELVSMSGGGALARLRIRWKRGGQRSGFLPGGFQTLKRREDNARDVTMTIADHPERGTCAFRKPRASDFGEFSRHQLNFFRSHFAPQIRHRAAMQSITELQETTLGT